MKKFSLFLLLLVVTTSVYSQELDGTSTDAGRKTTFIKNGFWDNWFIGAGAGANIYFGDNDANAKLKNRVTVTPNFQFGTWFNPYFGSRIKVAGGTNIHTFNNNASLMTRQKYISAEANFMWNVTDYLMSYNASRFYNFIPYVGAGYAYAWDYKNLPTYASNNNHVSSITLDAGIINRFKFSDRVALDIEFSAKSLRDNFDQRSNGKTGYDILGTASASLIFNISKKATFTQAVLRDQNEIDALNSKVNSLQAEVRSLSNRPVEVVEPKIVIKEVVKQVNKGNEPVNNVVLFKINTTKVEANQEVNVYNVAQYLKNNPDMKVRIVGYTDKATGTATINERLSRERAQNVADIILNKYNIDKNRVIIDWKGQTEPPFSVDEWNRAVILYLEEVNPAK